MNKIIPVLIGVFLLALFLPTQVFAVTSSDTLFGCTSNGTGEIFNQINKINKTNGDLFNNSTFSGSPSINGCNGLTQDPTDGTWYGIFNISPTSDARNLATVNPLTGVISVIGDMGATALDSKYNSLKFNSTGALFATSGNNHNILDGLFIVNKSTGFATLYCTLPTSQFHTLFFNYNDDFLYVMSGTNFTTDVMRIEKILNTSPTACTVTTTNISGADVGSPFTLSLGWETFGATFHTGDNLIYVVAENFGGGGTKFFTVASDASSISVIDDTIGSFGGFTAYKGLEFELVLAGADTTDPVITTTVSEPIPIKQDSVFDEFEFVSCIDDTDGDITNSMATVGSVDTSIPRSYSVDYTCTDVATNESELQVDYIIKRPPSGSAGTTPSAPSAPAPSAPAPSGVPTLQFTGDEVDRAFDLFATLNQLFAPTEPAPAPTAPTAPTTPTPTVPQESFIDAIRSFFSSLFG